MPDAPFPDWVEPLAATLTQDRFAGPEWIFERKIDGIRLLAFKNGADVRLLSRNRLPQRLPSIADAVAALPPRDLILDGEATWNGLAYHVFEKYRIHNPGPRSYEVDYLISPALGGAPPACRQLARRRGGRTVARPDGGGLCRALGGGGLSVPDGQSLKIRG